MIGQGAMLALGACHGCAISGTLWSYVEKREVNRTVD